MNLRRQAVLAAIPALVHWPAFADSPSRMTPQQAYAEIERSGELRRRQIDGDLDAAKLKPPPGAKRILLQTVQLDGALHSSEGGPSVALEIENSDFRDIDLRGTRWGAPLVLDGGAVKNKAVFEDAQFDAAFVLHNVTFTGPAAFRRARFAAPVEIRSDFRATSFTGAISFTDARFAAPARFDGSDFSAGVRFDSSRFDADASFLGLKVAGTASFRNVIFGGDAELRFCELGDADFGDIEKMSVFMRLADFRGCTMRSLRLDYADMRGDTLLVNVTVSPGDLTLRQASLRGAYNDFSGLNVVSGKLDLRGAHITNLQMRWPEISPPLLRGQPSSDVLRPLLSRLDELKKDDEARAVSAVLADVSIEEQLPRASLPDQALLWVERVVWGRATGYGTSLWRIFAVAVLCWIILTVPLVMARRMRIGSLLTVPDTAPPLHQPMPEDDLRLEPTSRAGRVLQKAAYAFGLMFTRPDLRLRPVEPLSAAAHCYLLFMRGIGLGLLALMVLTLAKVSPVIQAVLGKIVG